jgi:hypothetical protein
MKVTNVVEEMQGYHQNKEKRLERMEQDYLVQLGFYY